MNKYDVFPSNGLNIDYELHHILDYCYQVSTKIVPNLTNLVKRIGFEQMTGRNSSFVDLIA